MSTDFRVYIACLAAYNNGWLRGKHWDPTEFADADDFSTAVSEWLASDEGITHEMAKQRREGYYNPEEWAIHDFEAPAGIRISEYESLSTVFDLAQALDEHGDAYAAYVSNVGIDYATPEGFEESYQGEHGSLADFAQQLYEDIYGESLGIEDTTLRYNIDWEGIGRDLRMSGDYYEVDGFVFRSI